MVFRERAYYSEHDTITGVWLGEGALRLRLQD
jgi:hypothetical protein